MQGRCYGRLDVALPAETFVAAATSLRGRVPDHALWSLPIVSSPALRCHALALACAEDARAVITDARLLEMDFGDWEGVAWSDIPRVDLDRWAGDVTGFHPPGGESFQDLVARVAETLATLRVPHLVVAHAGVVRAATHLLGGKPLIEAASVDVPYLTPLIPG